MDEDGRHRLNLRAIRVTLHGAIRSTDSRLAPAHIARAVRLATDARRKVTDAAVCYEIDAFLAEMGAADFAERVIAARLSHEDGSDTIG